MNEEVEFEEFIQNFVDFLWRSENISSSENEDATEGVTCHALDPVVDPAVDLATKLEGLKKRYSKVRQ